MKKIFSLVGTLAIVFIIAASAFTLIEFMNITYYKEIAIQRQITENHLEYINNVD